MAEWLSQPNWMDQLAVIVAVAIAGLFGGIIGIERELSGKPAGLRTHMLVSAAACLLVQLGNLLMDVFIAENQGQSVEGDPIRIIQAIVVGISFLGAGTILHQGGKKVEGLTTAASILLTAAVGMAVAIHQLVLALGVSVLAVITLVALGWIEVRYPSRKAPPSDDTPDDGDAEGGQGEDRAQPGNAAGMS